METLRDRFGGKRQLVVEYVNGYEQVDVAGAEITHRDGPRVTYQFDRETTTASELIGRISAKYRLRDLEVREPEIEDTIRRIYEEKLLEDHTLENQM
ncbi:MAG: hypothetical protein MUO67_20975 [Anaerolineales bacterium]|nr:hypothetical protein [Anaerolineales bacterium]